MGKFFSNHSLVLTIRVLDTITSDAFDDDSRLYPQDNVNGEGPGGRHWSEDDETDQDEESNGYEWKAGDPILQENDQDSRRGDKNEQRQDSQIICRRDDNQDDDQDQDQDENGDDEQDQDKNRDDEQEDKEDGEQDEDGEKEGHEKKLIKTVRDDEEQDGEQSENDDGEQSEGSEGGQQSEGSEDDDREQSEDDNKETQKGRKTARDDERPVGEQYDEDSSRRKVIETGNGIESEENMEASQQRKHKRSNTGSRSNTSSTLSSSFLNQYHILPDAEGIQKIEDAWTLNVCAAQLSCVIGS